MAEDNRVLTSMIGMGYYGTITPAVIQRNVLENPGWYTAYTPYQAEVSQGRLGALLNFQQMVADLTGLELANASLLDEATAAAEAMAMARRVSRSEARTFFVDADCHPQTLAVLRTRAEAFGFEVVVGDPFTELDGRELFGGLLHYPGSSGAVRDFGKVIAKLHDMAALAIMATDLLSLVLLTPPGELGADVAIGSAQRFGVPMGYGGPHAAFFATKDEFKRAMPGRLIGVSVDARGPPRASHGAPDARAAHPAREGDQQHLHRPGPAGGHGRDVRRLSRPRRPRENRFSGAPPGRDSGRRAAPVRHRGRDRCILRHADRPRPRPGGDDRRHGARRRDQPPADRCRPSRHRPRRDDPSRRS